MSICVKLRKIFLQSSVDRMLKRGNASMMVGASSWKDQFVDAFTVQAGNNIYYILLFMFFKTLKHCPNLVFLFKTIFVFYRR